MFVHQEFWRDIFKPGFSVHNNHWNLCVQVLNSKWLLCCRKEVLNVCIKISYVLYKSICIMYTYKKALIRKFVAIFLLQNNPCESTTRAYKFKPGLRRSV